MSNITTDAGTRQLLRELKITRVICMISSLLTLCLLAGGVFLFGKVGELIQMCEPVVEKVSELDVESLNDTLGHVNASLEEVDWEEVADALGSLDVSALNAALEGLDTRELSESLKNLNDAVEMIRELGERMSSMLSSFGDFFDKKVQ